MLYGDAEFQENELWLYVRAQSREIARKTWERKLSQEEAATAIRSLILSVKDGEMPAIK